jgi:hypothetical protein
MRLLLALVSGFALTLGVFAAGAVLATFYLVGPTQERGGLDASDTLAMWSQEPVSVAYAPALSRPQAPEAADAEVADDDSGIDLVTTAAAATEVPKNLQEPAKSPTPEAEMLATAHLDWCYDRYRSYRPEDNSYRPYGGGRAFCVSPYLEQLAAGEQRAEDVIEVSLDADGYGAAAEDDGSAARFMQVGGTAAINAPLTDEHMRYCFDRYRSYRPQDNSYQPYGGGPRRQCL